MSKPIFTYTDGSDLHVLKASKILDIEVWMANRVRDEAHVDALEAAVQNPQDIQGPFSVIQYTDEAGTKIFNLIDGQHRQEVIRRHFARNPTAPDFEVLTRRYQIQNREEAVAIFQRINMSKPMVYRGSSTERLHEIVQAITKEFMRPSAKGFVQLIRPKCNRPSLNVEYLEEAVKRYGIHESQTPVADIVAHAMKMNAFYKADTGRLPGIKVTTQILEKATELEFYLGLDPKCSWLLGL